MSTPNKTTVNADSIAAQDALRTAANSAFIADADIVIQQMVDRGKFSVSLPVIKPASFKDIASYYQNLGYGATYEACSNWISGGSNFPFDYPFDPTYPSYSYFAAWNICSCKSQCKITISWK